MYGFLNVSELFCPRCFRFGNNDVHDSMHMMGCPKYQKAGEDSHCKRLNNKSGLLIKFVVINMYYY